MFVYLYVVSVYTLARLLTLCIAEFLNYKINKFFKLMALAQRGTHTPSMAGCDNDSSLELVAEHKPQQEKLTEFLVCLGFLPVLAAICSLFVWLILQLSPKPSSFKLFSGCLSSPWRFLALIKDVTTEGHSPVVALESRLGEKGSVPRSAIGIS